MIALCSMVKNAEPGMPLALPITLSVIAIAAAST